jgi:hypothetical protein
VEMASGMQNGFWQEGGELDKVMLFDIFSISTFVPEEDAIP